MTRAAATLALVLALGVLAPAGATALVVDRIGATVRRHVGDVRACYLRSLALRPDLAGRIAVAFTVDAAGAVTAAHIESDDVGDPTLRACVLAAVRGWRFPAGDASETVTYPFELRP